MSQLERTRIRRHPERAVPDETSAILQAGLVAHVGFTDGEGPIVMPMLYGFSPQQPDRIVLHGSRASRLQKLLADGAQVCVTVTLIDGLVFSRSAKYHSANYRSVACFGRGKEIADDAEKERVLVEMTSRYFPGREPGVDYSRATKKDFDEITVVEVTIEESSAKARRGGPAGPADDKDTGLGSSGVRRLDGPR